MFPIHYLHHAAFSYPNRIAACDDSGSVNFRELVARSDALAAGLQALVGKPRPTVALLGPNSLEMLVALMAVHAGGCVLVPLNGRNAKPELDAQIARSRPDVLIVHRDYLHKFEHRGPVIRIVGTDADDPRSLQLLEQEHSGRKPVWEASLAEHNSIKFTGGSSGVPKGVMQSFRCVNTVIESMLFAFELSSRDVYLCAAPMTHGAGAMLLPILGRGGRVVMTAETSADHLLDLMEREHVTTTWMPPTLLYKLIDGQKARPRRLPDLAHLVWGGATASPARLREAQQLFGPVIETAFGQTEAPMILSAARARDLIEDQHLASVGHVLPQSEVAILDPQGRRLGPGEAGEICARGDLLMNGYFEMPEETGNTFRNGWLHTGDIGYIDEDGYLYVKDRIRDVVISGGFNVYPSDVEAALALHPAVSESVVFGVPDEHWGERVEAALELRAGHTTTAEELIAFCKERVGSVKTPKTIRIVDTLPRSPVGKVLRREAKAAALGNA